ncbi:hypothetical protein RB653_002858 [Dictyostelium firmibasis]|uniref:EGF-like domain-containing protein n=1 Tax=Dictyostelium firmibasis TaxID=79012 RepID=A0AAN7YZ14_9MYCE
MKSCILFLTICFLLFSKLKSQSLNPNDETCLGNLISNLELTSKYNQSNYCTTKNIACRVSNGEKYISSLIDFTSNSLYQVKYEDIKCFSSISALVFIGLKISSNFLQGPFPTLKSVQLNSCTIDYTQIFLNISSNLTFLFFNEVPTPISVSIKLSAIQNLNNFDFHLSQIAPSSNNVQLINDFPINGGVKKIKASINIDMYDLPNMDNIDCPYLQIVLTNQPNGAFNNTQTLNNLKSLSISAPGFSTNLSSLVNIPKNNTIQSLNFGCEKVLTSIVLDLSHLASLNKFVIMATNLSGFPIDSNKIPLILPQSINELVLMNNGKFSNTGEFLLNYSNLTQVDLSNNKLTGNFSQWRNSGFNELKIADNSLQGSIDSSWCTTMIYTNNNQLSGPLPSCFTCHISSALVKTMVSNTGGNSFTNINPAPLCTTLIPNLRYIVSTKILELYGQDLGFDFGDITTSNTSVSFNSIIKPSVLFSATVAQTFLPQYIDVTFKAPNQVYRLSTTQKAPSVAMIKPTISTKQFSFDGSYFNYNKSSFSILVDHFECTVGSATFYQVNCTIQSNTYNSNSFSKITINVEDYYLKKLTILTTTLVAYLNQTTSVNCASDCSSISGGSGEGICNTLTGQCYIGCPNNCTDGGTCDSIGVCICSQNRIFSDCSGHNCTSTCEHSSTCDTTKGVCKCVPNYQGEFCTIPSHYITSVIPCSTDGGEVSIDGWFGDDDDATHTLSSYTVTIGQLDCTVTSVNKSTIKCNLGSGTGTKNIKIINTKYTNVIFNGIGLFSYRNQIKTCPNNCTSINNGRCINSTGECECINKFTGFDCSLSIPTSPQPSTNSTVNNTGGVTINNQDTAYEISIISLNEISFDGSIIISHQLNRNWSIDSNNTELNKFKFSQTLINNTCTITYMIEEIKNENKNFTFGTTTFTLEKDSIKLTVSINNYQYQSTLNTLQLVFYSAVSTNTDSTDNNNECNKKEASIDTSEVNNQQVSNYIQISKNSKILVGRFINQVISDSRATFMSSTIIKDNNDSSTSTSSIKLGLNLPHCNECLIDPDFSVLVSPDFKQSCSDDGSNKNKWLIPVAVVVPVVGCALIFVVAIIIFKKNRVNIKIFALKLKPFKNKQQI